MKSLILLVLFFLLIIAGCTIKNNAHAGNKTMTGTIYVTGNMPFARLTLKTDNDSTFFLECADSIETFLYDNQGTKFEITYRNVTDSAGIKILNVSKARVLSYDNK